MALESCATEKNTGLGTMNKTYRVLTVWHEIRCHLLFLSVLIVNYLGYNSICKSKHF